MRFLLFALYAPMCSLGEIAVGERRMGWARPGRSAVLGLVAAALGIDRSDDAAHAALEAGLRYAVRVDAPGRPLMDYHTAQAPVARRGRTHATRREQLAADRLHTVLSSREWRSDACFTVALWPRAEGTADLDAIAAALRRPRFALYLGRKSAPLGLPLDPEVVEAEGFVAALAGRRAPEALAELPPAGGTAPAREIACDADAPGAPAEGRLERRRDAVASRARWQFADRAELVFREPPRPAPREPEDEA